MIGRRLIGRRTIGRGMIGRGTVGRRTIGRKRGGTSDSSWRSPHNLGIGNWYHPCCFYEPGYLVHILLFGREDIQGRACASSSNAFDCRRRNSIADTNCEHAHKIFVARAVTNGSFDLGHTAFDIPCRTIGNQEDGDWSDELRGQAVEDSIQCFSNILALFLGFQSTTQRINASRSLEECVT